MAVAMVIPCLLYWCYDKRAGRYALFSFAISSMFNQLVKNIVCSYRPWVQDARIVPDHKALEGAGGYSFPSGHAQSTASVMAGLGYYYRKYRWPIVVGIVFVVLIAFSRNFLGVHFPQDVIVGTLEGCVFAYIAWKILEWSEESEERSLIVVIVAVTLTALSLVYLTVKPYPMDYVDGELLVDPMDMLESCYKSAGALIGTVVGLFVEKVYIRFYTGKISIGETLMRLVVGAVLALVTYKLSGKLFEPLFGDMIEELFKHMLTFFVVTAGAPFLFRPLAARFFPASSERV